MAVGLAPGEPAAQLVGLQGVAGVAGEVRDRGELGGVIGSDWNGKRIVLNVLAMSGLRGLPTMPQSRTAAHGEATCLKRETSPIRSTFASLATRVQPSAEVGFPVLAHDVGADPSPVRDQDASSPRPLADLPGVVSNARCDSGTSGVPAFGRHSTRIGDVGANT